jgi:protein-L-isoaspartate O-methyltransferase
MTDTLVHAWLASLEERHLADLRLPEVTRALRALSSAYVERRHATGRALDTAGKRAAFALFYAPLHFLTVRHIISALGANERVPENVLDIGCGTGVAGAAWALASKSRVRVAGIDRHPAAVEEARWTYRQLQIDGVARQGDAARLSLPRAPLGIVAAYTLNELPDATRTKAWETMCRAAEKGAQVLVIEPIARWAAPWWNEAEADARRLGGRADEWRFSIALPPIVEKLDRAAGLHHREITARSIFIGG